VKAPSEAAPSCVTVAARFDKRRCCAGQAGPGTWPTGPTSCSMER
jgi:hypothetical protein